MAYGWLKLNRSFLEHDFWTDKRTFSRAEAWLDLLMLAFYETKTILINGQSVKVEPGQYCTTMVHLAERWGWTRKGTSNFLKLLEKMEMASTKRTSKYTLITLLNWGKYQTQPDEKEQQKSMKGASKEHQKSIKGAQNKNIKNIKNNKNNIYTLPAYKPYETDDTDLSVFEE